MGLLNNLFDNAKIKELAFGQLRKIMSDNGYTSIVLINAPGKDDGPLPGFDVHFFKEPIEVFAGGTVGISPEQYQQYLSFAELEDTTKALMISASEEKDYFEGVSTEMLVALHDDEVKELINRYLKAKKLQENGDDTTEKFTFECDPYGNAIGVRKDSGFREEQ